MQKPVLVVACLLILSAMSLQAQLRSPSSYTRRISGSESGGSSTRPAPPTPTPAAANPATNAPVITIPVDPVKARAQREETEKKTFEFLYRRALSGSSSAQYDVGLRFLNGNGVTKSQADGMKWLNAAATNGNAQAVKKLEELKGLTKGPEEKK